MKCANRGLFVCLQEGGQRKENGTQFWQFHFFSNVLEWGIIMKYGLDRGKAITFCCLYPYLSCKEKKGQIVPNMFLCSCQAYPQFWLPDSVWGVWKIIFLTSQDFVSLEIWKTQPLVWLEGLLFVLTSLVMLIVLIKLKYCSWQHRHIQKNKKKFFLKDLTQSSFSSSKCHQALRVIRINKCCSWVRGSMSIGYIKKHDFLKYVLKVLWMSWRHLPPLDVALLLSTLDAHDTYSEGLPVLINLLRVSHVKW